MHRQTINFLELLVLQSSPMSLDYSAIYGSKEFKKLSPREQDRAIENARRQDARVNQKLSEEERRSETHKKQIEDQQLEGTLQRLYGDMKFSDDQNFRHELDSFISSSK